MEGEQGLSSSSDKSNDPWFADYADNLCPFYLSIGVSANDYWHGDYSLFPFYVKAWELKQEHENYTSWLNGLYMAQAIGSCFSKDSKYPEKPFELFTKEEQKQRIDNKEKVKFMNIMGKINQSFATKVGDNNGRHNTGITD